MEGLDSQEHGVELGDVGYIHENGSFRRLFNITKGPLHVLNAGGVPVGFQPQQLKKALISTSERFLDPGLLQSKLNVNALTGAEISYKFECSSHCGALLVLKDYATKVSIEPNLQLENYMLDNHKSWHEFATDEEKFGRRLEPEDIILVRGVTKTSAWTMAAFLGDVDRAHRFSAGVKGGPIGSAGVKWSSKHSKSHACVHRTSPKRTEPSSDQCIFLNYYKVKYRLRFFPKVIKANADPPSPRGTPDDATGGPVLAADNPEIEQETDDSEQTSPYSPLNEILDYILEHPMRRSLSRVTQISRRYFSDKAPPPNYLCRFQMHCVNADVKLESISLAKLVVSISLRGSHTFLLFLKFPCISLGRIIPMTAGMTLLLHLTWTRLVNRGISIIYFVLNFAKLIFDSQIDT
ncbi:hypothetical protein BC629DRAFT_1719017 [Irpex lacteus]|nr:hypothetical protein BC629DRAFT_1719017 [Irpex lacteus]